MAATPSRRPADERGMTLIEMLIVIVILGILLAIAVPAYLKFKDKGNDAAARSNIRHMIAAVEAYKGEENTYVDMTIDGADGLKARYNTQLKGWDSGSGTGVTILSTAADTYCLKSVEGGITYYKDGPGSDIVTAPPCS